MTRQIRRRDLGALVVFALLTACADRASGNAQAGEGATTAQTAASAAPAAAAPDLETLAGAEARDAVAAARAGLPRFLAALPADGLPGYGFAGPAELQRAALGAPYRVWTNDAAGSALAATSEWRFPVIVDGVFRALLTVAKVDGAYLAVDFGAAQLSRELGGVERDRAVAPGARRVLLRLPAVQSDLVAFPPAGATVEDARFEPLASARAARGGPRAAVDARTVLPWVRERLGATPVTR